MELKKVHRSRNSSIELLKIIAILLIVTSHVVQTLGKNGSIYTPLIGYGLDLKSATEDIQILIISMLRYTGIIGNTIFFVCSAWFLLESNNVNKKKILMMLSDIWIISIILLTITLLLTKGQIHPNLITFSLFPITFENNWYLTCYIIFYAIHPFLNKIIYESKQRSLLRITGSMIIMYLVIAFIGLLLNQLTGSGTSFWCTRFMMFIVTYFIIAYMKLYLPDLANDMKTNLILFIVGFIGTFGIVYVTNVIQLNIGLWGKPLLIWNKPNNPFIIMMIIGLFNLARNVEFHNKIINYISSLSLYIYIIHENRVLRSIYRPAMWNYIYVTYGYDHVLMWVGIFVIVLFVFGLLSSIFYFETIHKLVVYIDNRIYPILSESIKKVENRLLQMR